MGQALEVVEATWNAFATGGLDAYMERIAPDVSWRAIPGAPDDHGVIEGREAVRAYIEDWMETFPGITNVPEELEEIDEQRVLSTQLVTGTAGASGIETELRYALVTTVRDGLIVRGREYADREAALAAIADGTA
jgi:ketosteroid isomerase-like protein